MKRLYLLLFNLMFLNSSYLLHAAPKLLHKLAQFGPSDYIRDLIQSGTNPDLPDSENRTPLIFAASSGNNKNFLTLLGSGAQLLKQDKQHRNALTHAIQSGQKKKIKLALAAIYLLSLNKEQAQAAEKEESNKQKQETIADEPKLDEKSEKEKSDSEPEKEF